MTHPNPQTNLEFSTLDKNPMLDNELYQYIPPPNPLVPKNKYTDDAPRSHIPMTELPNSSLRRLEGTEIPQCRFQPAPHFYYSPDRYHSLQELESDPSKVVYRKFPETNKKYTNTSLLDIRKLLRVEESLRFEPIHSHGALQPFYEPGEFDRTLVFESRFECGNLALAVKESDNEYTLVLENDINTKGHTEWYYFEVGNTTTDLTVTFNTVNLGKGDSLYNEGMKVLVFSETENQTNNTGWFRSGSNISYTENEIRKGDSEKTFFTFSFTYTFEHTGDKVYFAYSHPYTYSELMADLKKLDTDPLAVQVSTRRLLCQTLGGNRCDFLNITSPATPEETKKKRGAVISARVHPGESVGSWMMKGVIDFLTGPSKEAFLLRENFIFKLIPMLNPDGVISGNYRCSLLGVDLNRRWKEPNKELHPTIFHTKKLIKSLSIERSLELACDLHGHSRRKNIFMYGCNFPDDPAATRAFPYILSKICSFFSYPYCSFRMQKSKEATMRISMFKETEVPTVYTCEASFCGSNFGPEAESHYSTKNLMEMGEYICKALLIYCEIPIPKELGAFEFQETENEITKKNLIEELVSDPILLQDPSEDSSSGSDSAPSEDNFDPKELAQLLPNNKRKKTVKEEQKTIKQGQKPESPVVEGRQPSIRTIEQPNEKRNLSLSQPPLKKCLECGNIDSPGHVCNKPRPREQVVAARSEYSESEAYLSPSGKKVRDEATQTVKVIKPNTEKRQAPSPSSLSNGSVSPTKPERANSSDKTHLLERQFGGGRRPGLPNLPRNLGKSMGSPGWKLMNRRF